MVINWTNPAIQDLKDFAVYTQMSNVTDYIICLVESVNLLTGQPKLGKIFTYTNKYIIRQLIHEKHRIFYYIDDNIINIIAIIHHKQDVKRKIDYIKKYLKSQN